MTDHSKPTLDLIMATKAVYERDLGLGLVTEDQLRYTITARKEAAKELSAQGMSTRQIAKVTGAAQRTIARDLREPNGSKSEPNASPKKVTGPTEADNPAAQLRALVYTRIVEALAGVMASAHRDLSDNLLREVFEEVLAKRRELLG